MFTCKTDIHVGILKEGINRIIDQVVISYMADDPIVLKVFVSCQDNWKTTKQGNSCSTEGFF